jgi:hypothetical protein
MSFRLDRPSFPDVAICSSAPDGLSSVVRRTIVDVAIRYTGYTASGESPR